MGATFSSPQLGKGLVPVDDPSASSLLTSAFTVHPSDTNSLGFSATMSWMGTAIEARYTDTNSIVKTATCSSQILSYVHQRGDDHDTRSVYGSILCPIANTQIGTGPLTFSLDGNEAYSASAGTFAMYFGRTTVTVSRTPTQTTIIVPGQTTYLVTETSTAYTITESVAITTFLTGQYPPSRCSNLQVSSPTTLSTSTRSSIASSTRKISSSLSSSTAVSSSSRSSSSISSSVRSSRASSSTSTPSSLRSSPSTNKSSSSSLATRSIVTKLSSSSRVSSSRPSSSANKASPSSKTSSTISQSSSSKTTSKPTGSKSTSKLSTSKAISTTSPKPTPKTTNSKISSKTTSSSRNICSTGADLESLSAYPSVASRLCREILSNKQTFPSSISVWPASRLSSACSCYGTASPTKISVPPKRPLFKRTTRVVAATSNNTSAVSSTSTSTAPTTMSGYGPPTIYSVPTTTITTTKVNTVYITKNAITLNVTTTTISLGTTTITTNSTVTIDQRQMPTTCVSDSATINLSARSLTCTNLKLHTALVWIMMKNPFDFCAYYLTANHNTSPLLEMSASTLKDTCSCLISHASTPLPIFRPGTSYSPKPKRQCNMSVASVIKGKYKEPEAFCKYYTSTSRRIPPYGMLKPVDLFEGCSCLI